jgi:hypothetical protein
MADVTVDYGPGGTVSSGRPGPHVQSNAASEPEGCHWHLIAQLQVIMSDLLTSIPVGDRDDILQMIVCLRDDNLGGCSAIEGDLRLP